MKKLIISLSLIIVLLIGFIVAIFCVRPDRTELLFSSQSYYTEQQMQEKIEDTHSAFGSIYSNMKEEIDGYKLIIENNERMISAYQNIISELQTTTQNNSVIIASLNGQVASLEGENQRLQFLIEAYENALPNYVGENERVVTYKVEDRIITTLVVEVGTVLTENVECTFPSGSYDEFNFWMLDNEEVNPVGLTITENTTFVANITKKYSVFTNVNGTKTAYVITSLADLPTPTETINGLASRFNGWVLTEDSADVISDDDLSNYLDLYPCFSQQVSFRLSCYEYNNMLGIFTKYSVGDRTVKGYVGDDLTTVISQLNYVGDVAGFGYSKNDAPSSAPSNSTISWISETQIKASYDYELCVFVYDV